MKKRIVVFLCSVGILFFSSYLASYSYTLKMLVGFTVYMFFTARILRTHDRREKTILLFLIELPVLIILFTFHIIDFEKTLLSLPSTIALALGPLAGLFLLQKKTYGLALLLIGAIVFFYLKGYDMYDHKLVFGNYTGTVNENVGDFRLYDIRDSLVTLNDFKEEMIVLNFWNLHCVPCIKEFPEFERLTKLYENKGVQLYAVNIPLKEADSREKCLELLNKRGVEFANLFAKVGHKTNTKFGVDIYPTLIVLVKGKIILRGSLADVEKLLRSRT